MCCRLYLCISPELGKVRIGNQVKFVEPIRVTEDAGKNARDGEIERWRRAFELQGGLDNSRDHWLFFLHSIHPRLYIYLLSLTYVRNGIEPTKSPRISTIRVQRWELRRAPLAHTLPSSFLLCYAVLALLSIDSTWCSIPWLSLTPYVHPAKPIFRVPNVRRARNIYYLAVKTSRSALRKSRKEDQVKKRKCSSEWRTVYRRFLWKRCK